MQRLLFKIVKGLFYKLSLYIETELPIKYFGSSYGDGTFLKKVYQITLLFYLLESEKIFPLTSRL